MIAALVLFKRFSRSAGVLPVLCLLAVAGTAAAAGPGIKTKPGELVIDPPTLINLGFEWPIEGDDNRNASVKVSYRRTGDSQWKQGLIFDGNGSCNLFNVKAALTSRLRTITVRGRDHTQYRYRDLGRHANYGGIEGPHRQAMPF